MIASTQNARFKALKALSMSTAARREAQQTLLDGAHLIEAFIDAGRVPQQILLADEGDENYWRQRCPQAAVLGLTPHLLAALSPVKTPTGVMALIDIPRHPLSIPPNFAVLMECIQDPGNVGAMLRTAAAAGVDTVYLSPGCADAWSSKVLRSGMGAHFALRIEDGVDLLQVAANWPGHLVATTLDATCSVYDIEFNGAVAFVMGNEGAGLSSALREVVTHAVHIPMSGRVESLNVAAALAVCLFERVRRVGVSAPIKLDKAGS